MMTHPLEITTLDDLKANVAKVCTIGDMEASCRNGNYVLAAQQTAQRLVTDYITHQAVRCAGANEAMPKSKTDARRMAKAERRIRHRVHRFTQRETIERRDPTGAKCGFIPIIGILAGSLISWLIEKALSFLWGWLFSASRTTVAALAVETQMACGATWDDDDDE